jgi:hypothetical protein
MGTEVTQSENHPGWEKELVWTDPYTGLPSPTPSGHPADYGGDFTNRKSYVEYPKYPVAQLMDSGWYTPFEFAQYEKRESQTAAILPVRPSLVGFPPSAESSESGLRAIGATAIARCAPRNNVAALATTLIETYRDGIPHLLGHAFWKARARGLKDVHSSLGDEYLNVQFGWQPLRSDIRDFSRGVMRTGEVYQQFAKDSGKVVRRRYEFPPTTTSVDTTISASTGPVIMGNRDASAWYQDRSRGGLGAVVRNRQTTIRRWFSGAFTYYIPPMGDSFVDHANQAVEVLGLDLNPESLWAAAPWSWAVDRFTNVGDLIHNVNSWSSDGLVMKYGYVMEHSLVRDTYSFIGDAQFRPSGTYPEVVTLVTETKLRRRATPFGFSISPVLTDRQKLIAAALGLTRLRW